MKLFNRMNKKGESDLIEIIITLFVVAILALLVITVALKVTPMFQSVVTVNGTAYNAIQKTQDTFTGGLDGLFVGILVILLIGMVLLAFFISSSPLFIPIFLIIAAISVWFGAIIANTYMTVEATGLLNDALVYMPRQNFVMEHLPYFIAGFAFILLIITYSKDIMSLGRQGIQQ